MSASSVATVSFNGTDNYNGLLIGSNEPPEIEEHSSIHRKLFSVAKSYKKTQQPQTITVAEGTPFISGIAGNDFDESNQLPSVPDGVQITIIDPNGNEITGTDDFDSTGNLLLTNDKGAIETFMIQNPIPGEWTVNVDLDGNDDVVVWITTLPTLAADVSDEQVIESVLSEYFDTERFKALTINQLSVSMGCGWCIAGVMFAGAVVLGLLLGLGGAGIMALTGGSVIVIYIAEFAGMVVELVLEALRGLGKHHDRFMPPKQLLLDITL